MNVIPPIYLTIGSIVVDFLVIYIAYNLIARKLSTQANILKATLAVTLGVGIIVVLSDYLIQYIPAGCDLIAAVMLIYHFGRAILKLDRKRSIYAALLYIGILLVVVIAIASTLAFMMH